MQSHATRKNLPASSVSITRKPAPRADAERTGGSIDSLRESAIGNPSVMRLKALQLLANSGARPNPLQLERKRNRKTGILYFTTKSEAEGHLRKYALQFDIKFGNLSGGFQEQCVNMALNSKVDGIEGAERLIWGEHNARLELERRAERRDAVQDDANDVLGKLNEDLTIAAFKEALAAYIGGARINVGVGGTYTSDEYDDALLEWKGTGDRGVVANFHGFDPQDKEAEGKGNVGATLDTRRVQGNLLVSFQGKKINVHVDISG